MTTIIKNRSFKASMIGLIAGLAFTIIFSGNVLALHSPLSWYLESPGDINGNKVMDRMEELPYDTTVDVFINFLHDCAPDSLLSQLEANGDITYKCLFVASVLVENIRLSYLLDTVAYWDEVGKIHPNDSVYAHMATAGQSIGAHSGFYSLNTAEDAGFDGSGITIAVVDGGIDDIGNGGHPDLPAPIAGAFISFVTGDVVGGVGTNPTDLTGHGTAVAGCALGRGSGAGHTNRGIASGASLVDCCVWLPTGGPTTVEVIKMLDWINLNAATFVPPIRVVNMSIGSEIEADGTEPIIGAINALIQNGIVVCVSAGNHDNCPEAFDMYGMLWPAGFGPIAITPQAITVGAANHSSTPDRADDAISVFSRVGPTPVFNNSESKPNLCAYGGQGTGMLCPPGNPWGSVTQAMVVGPVANVITTDEFGGYSGFGGTSAACPMVSGACALILEQDPSLTPTGVKNLLNNEAEDRGPAGFDDAWGNGLIDLRNIFAAPPPACDLAVLSHSDIKYTPYPKFDCHDPVTVTATVTNVGTSTVSDFGVSFDYWYVTPGVPNTRFDLTTTPIPYTGPPVPPGGTGDVTGVFEFEKVKTKLSEHTCFWATVEVQNDVNVSNNERFRNATCLGLNGTQCRSGKGGGMAKDDFGDTLFWPMRMAHTVGWNIPITTFIHNPDTTNWDVFLEHDGMTGTSMIFDVDPYGCPVDINLCAYALDTAVSDSITIVVHAYNEEYMDETHGGLTMTFLARDMQATDDCGDTNGDGAINILDITYLINYLYRGGPAPDPLGKADVNSDGTVNILDITYLINYLYKGGPAPDCP